MKLKSEFLLHSMGEEQIAVPVNERTKEFHGVVRLNHTGAFLWNRMTEEVTKEELVEALLDKYEVTPEQAVSAVEEFVKKLAAAEVLE